MEIVGAYERQKSATGDGSGMRLPAKVAWTRRVNLERLGEARDLIRKALGEIQQKYTDDIHSDPAGEKGERRVKPEYAEKFIREQTDILTQETDVNIKTVQIEDLDGINLTDADMDTLAFMIGEG